MNRRSYLKTTGTVLGASAVGTGVAAADYDNVVDIAEAGADTTGEEPIDEVFDEVKGDDTLVEFPEGEYLARELIIYDLTNFAMRATGDVTLVADGEYSDPVWLGGSANENVAVEGFTLDHTDDDANPSMTISATDGLVVRDIEKRGYQEEDTSFSFRVTTEDGEGLVENLRANDGGRGVGVYCQTTGTMTFRDCQIDGFGNNGLYASNSEGPVQVQYGRYRNSNVAQIRLGSPGSYVKGADVEASDSEFDDGNVRGIRIADGPGPVTIEDCDLRMESGEGSAAIAGAYSGGSFEVRNTRIYVGRDYTTTGTDYTGMGILVDEPTGVDDPGERVFENVSITGEGVGYSAMLFRRDNNRLENVCISQSGDRRKGIVFTDESQNNTVVSASVDVPGEQINEIGSVSIGDIDDTADCAVATLGGDEDDGEQTTPEPSDGGTSGGSGGSGGSDEGADSGGDSDDTSGDDGGSDGSGRSGNVPSSGDSDSDGGTSTSADAESESSDDASADAGDDLPWSDVPLVSPRSRTYATMGTDEDNPTAVLYGSYKCPYTADAVNGNLETIVDEFVRTGELNIEFRTLAYDTSDPDHPLIGDTKEGERAGRVGLGVWNEEPENFWQYFKYVFEQTPDDWSLEHMVELMKEADVRNWGRVRWLVKKGYYEDAVKETVEAAQEDGVSFVPRLVLDGDEISPHRDEDLVLEWISQRL